MFSIKCIEFNSYLGRRADSNNYNIERKANSRSAVTLITVKSFFA